LQGRCTCLDRLRDRLRGKVLMGPAGLRGQCLAQQALTYVHHARPSCASAGQHRATRAAGTAVTAIAAVATLIPHG
jgi:hypothetical protein